MPAIFEKEIPYKRTTAYTPDYSKKYYKIYYYSFKNFQKLLDVMFPWLSSIRRFLTRGFTDGRVIYLLDKYHWYSKIGHKKLIEHEIGHIEGYEHHWFIPDVMHPLWIFRWSDKHW